jgi:hypothetical protein
MLESDGWVTSRDVRHHVDWLLTQLCGKEAAMARIQETVGVSMTVMCVWWSMTGEGGPTLWPEQMRGLADLGLELSFSFQAYVDE